ncbi:MAG: hypothetical protein QNJ16_10860 [Rhodobacter sp.]|nr:hypothetical protein [Rhodobacter sp.]
MNRTGFSLLAAMVWALPATVAGAFGGAAKDPVIELDTATAALVAWGSHPAL